MPLFRRRRTPSAGGTSQRGGGRRARRLGGARGLDPIDRAHLENFARTRRGVEAFVEPATTVTPWTVLFVADDGEWTRRPCDQPEDAHAFAKRLGVRCYDVAASGYPQRMRDWSRARKEKGLGDRPALRHRPADHEMPPDPFV